MIRRALAGENRKRTGKILLFLGILAILLAGALPIVGQNVFASIPARDVSPVSFGYIKKDLHYVYTGKENSWILIQNSHDTQYIVVKFREEAEADIPVRVREFTEDNTLLEEQETVWKKGSSITEVRPAHGDTVYIELHIPADFTLDRSVYAVHYQRFRKSAVFFAGVLAAVLLGTLFLSGTRPGCAFVSLLSRKWREFLDIFDRERMRKYRLEWTTFILIVFVGALYAFFEPPYTGMSYDDEFHYLQSVEFGHIYSSAISYSDYDVWYQTTSGQITSENFRWEERCIYSHYLNEMDRRGYIMIIPNRGRFRISVVPYIPYMILHLILKTLHVPWTVRLMIGRWVYAWLLGLFTALGMKRLRSGKLVAAVLSLTPGIVFLAGNYSYDTWVTMLYLYGMCCVFGELQKPQELIGLKTPAKMFTALALAGIPKPVYFPINAISFFMPRGKFKSRAGYWLYKLSAVLCTAFPLLLTWLRTFAGGMGTGDTRGGSDVNAAVQVQLALEQPARFARVILQYLKDYLNPFGFGKGWANNLAYLGNLKIGGLIFVLIMAAVLVSLARKEPGRFPWWYRLGLLFEYFAIGAIVTISMYVVFTPVGSDVVLGAQQRYLTPVLFPAIYGITRISGGKYLTNRRFQTAGHILLLAAMTAVNVYAIWSLCLIKYWP